MTIIYHLTSREAWAAAQDAGHYEAPSLADEGFIHCSADEAQTLRMAERLYAGASGLQVLDVDTVRLEAEVKTRAQPLRRDLSPRIWQDKPRRRHPRPRSHAGRRRQAHDFPRASQ